MVSVLTYVSVSTNHPGIFLVFLAGLLILTAVATYFSRKYVIRRKLKKIPLLSISNFQSGSYGKIIGRAYFGGEILEAPLSGRKCVYYFFKIEAQRNKSTETLVYEEYMGDLVITDGKDYALIQSSNVKAFLVPDRNCSSGPFDKPTPKMEQVIKKYKIDPENLIGLNRNLKYEEGILAENEECIVSGMGRWEPASKYNLNVPAQRILVMSIHPDDGLLLSDDPKTIKGNKEASSAT